VEILKDARLCGYFPQKLSAEKNPQKLSAEKNPQKMSAKMSHGSPFFNSLLPYINFTIFSIYRFLNQCIFVKLVNNLYVLNVEKSPTGFYF